jgi:hypothetical protein
MCALLAIVDPAVSLISCAYESAPDALVVHPTSPRSAHAVSDVAVGFEHVAVCMTLARTSAARRRTTTTTTTTTLTCRQEKATVSLYG